MPKLTGRFAAFVNISLRILLFFVLVETLKKTLYTPIDLGKKNASTMVIVSTVLIAGSVVYAYIIYRGLKAGIKPIKIVILILSTAFILRLLWILNINTVPISDFQVIFESGRKFISGDYSIFKGTDYIARFTHLTLSVIYYGLFHKVFSNPLMAIKVSNVVWSTLNVYLIYLLVSELYDDKEKGVWGAFGASIFPSFIMYTSVLCTENHAMPFFLTSIYIFIQVIKERKSSKWMLLSGALLFVGHVFRMVGSIIIIAYIIYILLYFPFKKGIKYCGYIIASFIVPLYVASNLLLSLGITENPLWKGREPASTSILRGTNISSNGAWNEEDAKIPEIYNYDYKEVEKASKEIIKERLTTTPALNLIKFYLRKFTTEWSHGDFAALYWSTLETDDMNNAYFLSEFTAVYSQLVYFILFSLTYIGLFNSKQYKDNGQVNLFYILFCGFGLLYLITENQTRYGYIASWVFLILTFTSIENGYLKERFVKIRNSVLKHSLTKSKGYYSES